MKQGKCDNCEITFRWNRDFPANKCTCPECKFRLKRTTRQFKKYPVRTISWPWHWMNEVA